LPRRATGALARRGRHQAWRRKPGTVRKTHPHDRSNQQQPASATRLQTFGFWLDTAFVNAPGETWMWVSTSYWRSPSLREIDAPAIGVNVGVAPRTQVGVSLPYYHLTDQFGFTSHGLGASYATLKLAVVQDHRVNVSVSPTLEILSWSSPQVGRINAVLPINVQTFIGNARVYGSTGYFSRGSVFGSGAAEWSPANSLTLTTTLAHSYSVVSDPASDRLGISKHRTDASGGMYVSGAPIRRVLRKRRPDAVARDGDKRPAFIERRTDDQRRGSCRAHASRSVI
jgi:hypothetical protein